MQFDLQIVPVYGLSLGFFYYDPNLEQKMNGLENVDEDEFYVKNTSVFYYWNSYSWF